MLHPGATNGWLHRLTALSRRMVALRLARLARWIDDHPGYAATDDSVMIALQARFAGAPSDWLRVVAQRAPQLAGRGVSATTCQDPSGPSGRVDKSRPPQQTSRVVQRETPTAAPEPDRSGAIRLSRSQPLGTSSGERQTLEPTTAARAAGGCDRPAAPLDDSIPAGRIASSRPATDDGSAVVRPVAWAAARRRPTAPAFAIVATRAAPPTSAVAQSQSASRGSSPLADPVVTQPGRQRPAFPFAAVDGALTPAALPVVSASESTGSRSGAVHFVDQQLRMPSRPGLNSFHSQHASAAEMHAVARARLQSFVDMDQPLTADRWPALPAAEQPLDEPRPDERERLRRLARDQDMA
ncbi:hypothetical protein [Bradyrhizobium sp. SZCCHNS3051]|uniref:hypothetical protein n=1 Tax=Bradyrhizobium sp. SZCCHNS3051 TaxID=3057320 RepID=UPI002915FC8E|nr:hypothetical protein [Bradyrhizobium sp. SZCCHNS3051]